MLDFLCFCDVDPVAFIRTDPYILEIHQYRTLPLVFSLANADVATSHHCCASYTGCQSRDEWSLRLRVLYTSR